MLELEHLIELYRENGLHEAADLLTFGQKALHLARVLPPTLPGYTDQEHYLTISRAKVRIDRRRNVSLADTYEIDELKLPTRTRDALIASGFLTIDDLEWAVSSEAIYLIDGVGAKGRRRIFEVIEYYPEANHRHK